MHRTTVLTDGPQTISRNHTAFVTWAVSYPLITVLLGLLEPLIDDLVLPLRTLVLSTLMVPIMVYWAVPKAISLSRRRDSFRRTRALSALLGHHKRL